MAKNRVGADQVGYFRSARYTYLVPSGNNGGNLGVIDLGRNYMYVVIWASSMTGIAASTLLSAQVAWDPDDPVVTLYERDFPGVPFSQGNLPTSGSWGFVLVHALGIQKIKLLLSVNTTGAVTFYIYGFGASVAG